MDNRLNIIDCALQLFAERGFDAVGVQEIVDAAGITKPTLYHYFGSKHGLLEGVLETNFNTLFDLLGPAADYQGDLVLTLEKITRTLFDFSSSHPAFYRLILPLWFAPRNSDTLLAVSGHNQRLFTIIETVFTTAVKEHGNMKGRQLNYSATFLGMIQMYISLSLNGYVDLDDRLVYSFVHQFMHGILT